MTPNEQAIEAVARALWRNEKWVAWDDVAPAYQAPFLAAAATLVAQITPLLTADLQAKLDAAEADKRQAVEAEKERCAECVKMMLEDEGISLQQISDTYRDAMVSGIHNGRKIPKDAAKSFARHFAERSDAVYQMGDHAAAAIRTAPVHKAGCPGTGSHDETGGRG